MSRLAARMELEEAKSGRIESSARSVAVASRSPARVVVDVLNFIFRVIIFNN